MSDLVIKEFLEKIRFDIQNIDGGCPSCISEFCNGVNETLSFYGLMLKYDEDVTRKVEVVEIH